MKKCLKCGTKYEDKFMFCPEDGEKLVSINECPNCHLELDPKAKFCPHCGTKLGEMPAPAIEPTPAPEAQPAPAPQPAPQQAYANQQPQPKPARKRNTNVMRTVCNFVYMGMFIIVALLYLIGLFGNPYDLSGVMYGANIDFTIFFRYDAIASSGASAPFLVLLFMFYYLAFAGFIVTLSNGIPSVIRAFKQKDQPINTKPLLFTVMFILPHLIYLGLTSALFGYLGWGSIMLLLAVIYAVITIATLNVLGGELKAKPIVANALNGTAFFFAVLASVFGTIIGMARFLSMLVDVNDIEYYIENGGQFFFALGMMLCALTGSILLYIAVPKTRSRDRGIQAPIVLFSISVGFTTVGFIFSLFLFKQTVKEVLNSYVALCVFFTFTIGLLVAANKIDPKVQAVPQQSYRPQPQPMPAPQPQPMPQPEPAPQPQPMDNNNPYKM